MNTNNLPQFTLVVDNRARIQTLSISLYSVRAQPVLMLLFYQKTVILMYPNLLPFFFIDWSFSILFRNFSQYHKYYFFKYLFSILVLLFILMFLIYGGGTWVAQWLSICLWLGLWSWGPGIESHIRLPAGNLLPPLPMSLPLSVSLMNKSIKY